MDEIVLKKVETTNSRGMQSADLETRKQEPSKWQLISDAILGKHPHLRSRVKMGLLAIIVYLCWIVMHLSSALLGWISFSTAALLICHHVVGMVAFYPWVRSGYSARFQDSGLVQAQIMYGASASVLGYALNPKLGAALLQVLCFIHLFGMFTLRRRQLLITGCTTIVMLLTMLGISGLVHPSGFVFGAEANKIGFSCFTIGLITWMSILHSQRRGRLSKQKRRLAIAVQQYNELVTRDALTGLYNRKHMYELLNRERIRQRQTGKRFSLALIDLDHFKQINDTHGHTVGDEVLRSFAQTALATLRETETIARWGGEEFLVLMPETLSEQNARHGIDRLHEQVAMLAPSASVPSLRVTFSAGISLDDHQLSIDQVIECADRALYAAKKAGRNRSVFAHDTQSVLPDSHTPYEHCVLGVNLAKAPTNFDNDHRV